MTTLLSPGVGACATKSPEPSGLRGIGFGRAQPVGIFVELLSQAKRRQQRRIVVVIRVINDGVDQVCRGWQAICQISGVRQNKAPRRQPRSEGHL